MTLERFKKDRNAADLHQYLDFMRRCTPTSYDVKIVIAKCIEEIEREKIIALGRYYKPPPADEEIEILLEAQEICQNVFM
jgi:hypothetical protein